MAIACNQPYLDFRKITLQQLLGLTAYDLLSKTQADLYALADQYLLNSGHAYFEFEGHKEAVRIKINIRRVQFFDKNSDAIMVTIAPEITSPEILRSKIYLTNREYSVLQLLAQGNSQKQIALLLTLSRHTIAGYLKVIYIKLGVTSSTRATLIATTRLGMRAKSD